MAKLTVRNVGPIREAELEVKKHTVFIGPQGTGKSTLAKLIAMCHDSYIFKYEDEDTIWDNYSFNGWLTKNSKFSFSGENYDVLFDKSLSTKTNRPEFNSVFTKRNDWLLRKRELDERESNGDDIDFWERAEDSEEILASIIKRIIPFSSFYIPAERNLVAILSESMWALSSFQINLPQLVTSFGRRFESSKRNAKSLSIDFLSIVYKNEKGGNQTINNNENSVSVPFAQSASGYQSVIPLILTTEYLRPFGRLFIVEEPELNLYPTAQKDLIYSLIGGLQPDKLYQDAEWVITTHSPYVLSSFNTLMLAYKVGNQSEELRTEVNKIIPSRCWINPDEFAAYYVDNGTVRSIVSEQTGMIAENELDDVSDDLADEQDKLLALRHSITRA